MGNRYYRTDPIVRFMEKFELGPGSCWTWTAARSMGYGSFSLMGTPGRKSPNVRAHRWFYEVVNGKVPDHLQLDHLCRNRACVNPEHLEPVSNRENGLRGISIAAQNARKTHCWRGHPFNEENTIHSIGNRGRPVRTCRECLKVRYRIKRDKRAA